jgi:hypothetical protein
MRWKGEILQIEREYGIPEALMQLSSRHDGHQGGLRFLLDRYTEEILKMANCPLQAVHCCGCGRSAEILATMLFAGNEFPVPYFIERIPPTSPRLPFLEFGNRKNRKVADWEIPLERAPFATNSIVKLERLGIIEHNSEVEIAESGIALTEREAVA